MLISNHQSEADPAVISLLLEAQCPYIGENIVSFEPCSELYVTISVLIPFLCVAAEMCGW